MIHPTTLLCFCFRDPHQRLLNLGLRLIVGCVVFSFSRKPTRERKKKVDPSENKLGTLQRNPWKRRFLLKNNRCQLTYYVKISSEYWKNIWAQDPNTPIFSKLFLMCPGILRMLRWLLESFNLFRQEKHPGKKTLENLKDSLCVMGNPPGHPRNKAPMKGQWWFIIPWESLISLEGVAGSLFW